MRLFLFTHYEDLEKSFIADYVGTSSGPQSKNDREPLFFSFGTTFVAESYAIVLKRT